MVKNRRSNAAQNTAVRAAVLSLAICVCDVINEAGRRCKECTLRHETIFILLFIGKATANMAAPCRTHILCRKYFCGVTLREQLYEDCWWKYVHIFYVFGPTCVYPWGLFNFVHWCEQKTILCCTVDTLREPQVKLSRVELTRINNNHFKGLVIVPEYGQRFLAQFIVTIRRPATGFLVGLDLLSFLFALLEYTERPVAAINLAVLCRSSLALVPYSLLCSVVSCVRQSSVSCGRRFSAVLQHMQHIFC